MVDHYNSMFVKPFKVERLKDKQGRNVYRGFTHTNDPRFPPERDHIPVIRPRDVKYKGKISDCPAIIVECTCMRHMFVWEYADASRGDGLIWRGNGEPPLITNPGLFAGLCIAEGELVLTERGYIRIENVIVGDKVWTLKGWKKVTQSVFKGIKDVITVTLKSGRNLTLTPDHEVYTFKNKGYFSWLKAKDLTSDYSLCLSVPKDTKPFKSKVLMEEKTYKTRLYDRSHKKKYIKTDARLAELYGYMTAEGSYCSFAGCNSKLLEHFKDLWDDVFGKGLCNVHKQNITLSSHSYKAFKSLGFKEGSYNKDVPDWIMQSNNECIIAFLRGAYAGDGNFRNSHSTYATVSEPYARKIHLLLDRLGVRASLDCYKSGIHNVDTWVIRTSSKDYTYKLSKILKPIRGFSSVSSTNGRSDSHWDRIYTRKSIEAALLDSYTSSKDERYVTLQEYFKNRSGMDDVAKILTNNGKIIKKRIRSGGKLNNTAKICDIEAARHPYKVRKALAGMTFLRTTYSKNKQELIGLLPAVKDISEIAYNKLKDIEKVGLDRVDSISKVKNKKRVYDLTVEDAEHFTANGYVVHNCKHNIALGRWLVARGF